MARTTRTRQHERVREKAPAGYQAQAGERTLSGVLLDTDVIVEILRDRDPVCRVALQLHRRGVGTYVTAISCAEVFAGLRRGEEQLTEAFFEARGEVVLDGRTGRRAGEYLAAYGRTHGLEIADALVAAAASTSGLRLWTLNRRHYPMKDVRFWEPDEA